EHIADAIEQGAGTFVMPWHNAGSAGLPENASSRLPYQGVNILSLWISQQRRGYESNKWATFRQWKEGIGAQVKKGEKATPICYFQDISNNGVEPESTDGAESEQKRRIVARTYWVFNAAQVEGFKAEESQTPRLSESERLHEAERWLFGLGAEIRHGGNEA